MSLLAGKVNNLLHFLEFNSGILKITLDSAIHLVYLGITHFEMGKKNTCTDLLVL